MSASGLLGTKPASVSFSIVAQKGQRAPDRIGKDSTEYDVTAPTAPALGRACLQAALQFD
ncbi:hypothetical protein EFR01_15620 [Sinorhizobium fredii]|nr:hypothetical protein EFR01_15620 [Sinorhizobium fredii]GLS11061.1 hypothetical protein GCM10007864_46920 [Sinorhizobium fredii]